MKRYFNINISSLWSNKIKYRIWFELEFYITYALRLCNKISISDIKIFKIHSNKIEFSKIIIFKIEKIVKHEFISFLTYLYEITNEEINKIHFGLTSSDILDSALNIQIFCSGLKTVYNLNNLIINFIDLSYKSKNLIIIGRTHGIHAEPLTLGMKLNNYIKEIFFLKKNLKLIIFLIKTCSITGAVGTYSAIDYNIEKIISKNIYFDLEMFSTQIINRCKYAQLINNLSLFSSTFEKLALEIRNLQKTESSEISEPFFSLQKGSSAMPQKKNPILSECITGLSRLLRSYSIPVMENMVLWHERDISHSSVEREILPNSFQLFNWIITNMSLILSNLSINYLNLIKNLNYTKGSYYSQKLMLFLLNIGYSREFIYIKIQNISLNNIKDSFSFAIIKDSYLINIFSIKDVYIRFNLKYYIRNKNYLFKRLKKLK